MEEKPQLPKLPYGEGTYNYRPNGSIVFKKVHNGKRIYGYGQTPKEAKKNFDEKAALSTLSSTKYSSDSFTPQLILKFFKNLFCNSHSIDIAVTVFVS